MRKNVLDIQSGIHAHNMERMLMQELDDCQIVISESPDSTPEWCKMHQPDVLLMEVKAFSPWMFSERMAIRDKVKRSTENCRVVLFVDDESNKESYRGSTAGKARGSYRRFLVRLGFRELLCFGDRQRVKTIAYKMIRTSHLFCQAKDRFSSKLI